LVWLLQNVVHHKKDKYAPLKTRWGLYHMATKNPPAGPLNHEKWGISDAMELVVAYKLAIGNVRTNGRSH